MMLGNPNFFVCSVDYTFSLHPTMNGKPMKGLVTKEEIDNAFSVNPYKAQREYGNIFDNDGGENTVCKRSTILKYSYSFYPIYENDGTHEFIIAYDPSSKLDNSIIGVAELIRDEERGLMMKIVNCINLIELLPNGEKAIIQKPEQLDILKNHIIDYNKGALDYEKINQLIIDRGAGRGRFDLSQYLLNEWKGSDQKIHRGFIDLEDPFMSLRADQYERNCEKLKMFNFKRDKNQAYERTQSAINQGLVQFPKSLNAKNEYEIEEVAADGTIQIRYEKVTFDELNSLTQIELMKQEIVGMQKTKRPNGTIVFETSPEAKARGVKDDRSDVLAMLCDRLMQLRAEEALSLEEKPKEGFKEMFAKVNGNSSYMKKVANTFATQGGNPFVNRRRPN